jgi:hypothetical protein
MEAAMSDQPRPRFNPCRFADAFEENNYLTGLRGGALKLHREQEVDWLRKKHPEGSGSVLLANKLASCGSNQRCLSLACPECSFAWKAVTTAVAFPCLRAHPDRKKIVCVSVVPADGMITPGKLAAEQHVRNSRRWKEGLGRAGVTWFLGATDWSWNEHAQDRYEPHWSEHFYGFTATDDLEELKRKLHEQFPTTDPIPRPITVRAWNGSKKALQYMVKPDFFRRIGTDEGQRFDKNEAVQRECRATDKQPLRSEERFDLLIHLDQIGIQGRLLMRWLQFVHLKEGWTIADRNPEGRRHGKAKSWGKSAVS